MADQDESKGQGTPGPLRVGIIGCGDLGVVHARRFGQMNETRVAALSDPFPDAIARAVEVLPEPPEIRTADYRKLLEADLDLVCIASPDSFHVAQVLDSLDAGLHVLCEKPLTLDPGERQQVIEKRDRTGKIVSMTYPRRYSGGIRAMRREILSGRWGRVRTVSAYNAEDWITPNVGKWRHDPAICPGGFLYDASGHQLDTIFWVTGLDVEEVRAELDNRGTPVPITVWGTAKLTGGVPMSFCFIGDGHRWREQVNIHCEGMDFIMESGRVSWTKGEVASAIEPDEPGDSAETAFVRLLYGKGPNWSPPDDLGPLIRFTRAALRMSNEGGV